MYSWSLPEVIQLRLHDPAYFCENLYLYIFVLFSFIWSDGDLSSYIYDLFDIHVNYFNRDILLAKDKMVSTDCGMN